MIKFFTLCFFFCTFSSNAAINVSGSFEATDSCPTYLSKNRKANPDNLTVIPHQHYLVKEINKNPPDWLRIEFADNHHTVRWVEARCGVAEYTELNPDFCKSNPGMADSHVLALSSQPGFCQTYGYRAGKPECKKLSQKSYQANHLTLHGLWPNQDACGTHYGFCDITPRQNHCDYSPLQLSSNVMEQLKKLMPSFNYGSCLERHEWNKHGSCQILSTDDYFTLAMRLTSEMDDSPLGNYLTEHRGSTVKLGALRELIAKSFGTNNAKKITFGCKDGILVDMFIQLPALIPFNEPLQSLLNKATNSPKRDSCFNNVIISDFNRESWL